MDNLSNELNKLKIDSSKRSEPRSTGSVWKYVAIVLILLLVGVGVTLAFRNTNTSTIVETVRPRVESSSQSAVLVASGYVIAHHKIQVGSKIMGRVAWIGVEKGDRVKANQVVVRLEDREYRAQYDQAQAQLESTQARLNELERGSRPEEIERARHEMERAEAQLRTDEAQLRRTENLVKEGVASPQALDDARGRYDTSKANLASLTKTLDLIKQGPRQEQIDSARSETSRAKAAADYARTIFDATEVRVPIDG